MWSVAKVVRICEEKRRGAVRLDGGVEGHSAEELGSGDVLQRQCRGDGDVLRFFLTDLDTHTVCLHDPHVLCRTTLLLYGKTVPGSAVSLVMEIAVSFQHRTKTNEAPSVFSKLCDCLR